MDIIFQFFKDTFLSEFQTTMTGDRIAIGLVASFVMMLFVLFIYRVTYRGVAFNPNFCLSLMLLSLVTSVVIMTVTTNLALSLGMVGALSIVRFRTAVKDPTDTVFMFWAITVGIMAGAGLVYITVITNLSLGVLYLLFYALSQKTKMAPYLIVVRYQREVANDTEAVLKSLKNMKVKSKTVSGGVVELCIETKITPQLFDIVDSISKMEGVLDASAISYKGETTL